MSGAPSSTSTCPGASKYQLVLGRSIKVTQQREKAEEEQENQLQTCLSSHEAGALLDRSTPRDGHSLFHALRKGGLACRSQIPCMLAMPELRAMALSEATSQQLMMAFTSTREGMTAE
eukprot:12430909-Karenia_brevis.AAC.1